MSCLTSFVAAMPSGRCSAPGQRRRDLSDRTLNELIDRRLREAELVAVALAGPGRAVVVGHYVSGFRGVVRDYWRELARRWASRRAQAR